MPISKEDQPLLAVSDDSDNVGNVENNSEADNKVQQAPEPRGLEARSVIHTQCALRSDGSINSDDEVIPEEIVTRPKNRSESEILTSNVQSMMHLIKGMIGTGILAMPIAIKNAGIWTGTVGVLLLGVLAAHCMQQLVNCSHILCQRIGANSLDYTRVVEYALKTGPQPFQRLHKLGIIVINTFLCITQFGFCVVYILFIGENIQQVVYGLLNYNMNKLYYMIITTALLIPMVFIKSLKKLAPFSLLANVFNVVGLVIILQYCVRDLPPISTYPAIASWSTLPLYFGTAIYAFEGIGVVLPIENKMKTPEAFPGLTGVLNTSVLVVTVFYAAVGFYGYMKAGHNVHGSITLDLPKAEPLYILVKLMFSLSIFITFALQYYVPFTLIWPSIESKLSSSTPSRKLFWQYFCRAVIVIILFGVAASIPHLDLMISLIGALASSAIALIFPPILEILVLWPEHSLGRWKWKMWKNVIIILIGFLGFLTGTTTTIFNIINAFSVTHTTKNTTVSG